MHQHTEIREDQECVGIIHIHDAQRGNSDTPHQRNESLGDLVFQSLPVQHAIRSRAFDAIFHFNRRAGTCLNERTYFFGD